MTAAVMASPVGGDPGFSLKLCSFSVVNIGNDQPCLLGSHGVVGGAEAGAAQWGTNPGAITWPGQGNENFHVYGQLSTAICPAKRTGQSVDATSFKIRAVYEMPRGQTVAANRKKKNNLLRFEQYKTPFCRCVRICHGPY